MTITLIFVLAILALIATVVHAMGKCPLWVAVVLLCVIALIQSGVR